MNDNINEITTVRSVNENFGPVWKFSGTIQNFTDPLSEEDRQRVAEIICALSRLMYK